MHVFVLLVQLSSAVAFVAGWIGALPTHSANAWLVVGSGALQGILIVPLPAARLSHLLRGMSIAVPLTELVQVHFGSSYGMGTHVTVALFIWALSLALFIKVWAPTWKQQAA